MENKTVSSNFRFLLSLVVLCGGLFSIGTWSSDAKKLQTSPVTKPTQVDPATIKRVPNLTPKPDKYLGLRRSFPNSPIEITEVRVKGKPVQLNGTVREGTDWLNGLYVKVKNNSGKNIVFLELDLMFPETKVDPNEPSLVHPLNYGLDPKVYGPSDREMPIGPNKEVEFTVDGEKYQKLRRLVGFKTEPENINALVINLVMVIFDDDTAWGNGVFMSRDPNNPRNWIDVN